MVSLTMVTSLDMDTEKKAKLNRAVEATTRKVGKRCALCGKWVLTSGGLSRHTKQHHAN